MAMTRPYGEEQPYTGGVFKIRVPFIHYRLEYQDIIQGIILCCVPLGITAAMTQVMGIPIEIAVLMVLINNIFYMLHLGFGDPSVAGWITAGIPLYIAFLGDFQPGPERIQAMIALQVLVGAIFAFLGLSGISKYVIKHFPICMRAGILLGAGFASLARIFDPAEPFVSKIPISFFFSALFSFFMLFSVRGQQYRQKYGWYAWIAGFGIAPGFIVGYILGILTGEIAPPTGVFDRIIIDLPFADMINFVSVFSVGIPPLSIWLASISLAFVAYILAFGDILVLEALMQEATKSRPDEKIPVEPTRIHIVTATRNIIEGFFIPFLPLCGPQWTASQALMVNRYKYATPEQYPSYWGGASSFFWGMGLALLFHPIVQIVLPAKLIGFGLTLIIQGYLCIYLAFAICKTNVQRGIAGIMGAVLVSGNYVKLWGSPFWSGPTMGLIVGTVLYFILEYSSEESEEQKALKDRDRDPKESVRQILIGKKRHPDEKE